MFLDMAPTKKCLHIQTGYFIPRQKIKLNEEQTEDGWPNSFFFDSRYNFVCLVQAVQEETVAGAGAGGERGAQAQGDDDNDHFGDDDDDDN